MTTYHSFARRLTTAAMLAAAVFGTATLGVPATNAEPAPARAIPASAAPDALTIELRVSPSGTAADVEVHGTTPFAISHTLRRVDGAGGGTPVSPSRYPLGSAVGPLTGVLTDTPPAPTYETRHHLRLRGLLSNTTYEVVVNAATSTGELATTRQTFTTFKQRVRLTLDTITIAEDGDTFGNGEPTWFWQVDGFSGGPLEDCFPKAAGQCQEGDFSDGMIVPSCTRGDRDHRTCRYGYVFAEENFQPVVNPNPQPGNEDFSSMPQSFTLRVQAVESDFGGGEVINYRGGSVSWTVPQGQEHARQQVTLSANDDTFRSTMVFTFELFYDTQSYPPNEGRVASSAK